MTRALARLGPPTALKRLGARLKAKHAAGLEVPPEISLIGTLPEEAARLLRCPGGTVKGRLWRAREMLRGRLTRHGLALSDGDR